MNTLCIVGSHDTSMTLYAYIIMNVPKVHLFIPSVQFHIIFIIIHIKCVSLIWRHFTLILTTPQLLFGTWMATMAATNLFLLCTQPIQDTDSLMPL